MRLYPDVLTCSNRDELHKRPILSISKLPLLAADESIERSPLVTAPRIRRRFAVPSPLASRNDVGAVLCSTTSANTHHENTGDVGDDHFSVFFYSSTVGMSISTCRIH